MRDIWDQSWSGHARKRVNETAIAASAVLIATEQRAYLFRDDLDAIDRAIHDLQAAKALHLARLAEYDKEKVA